MIVDHEQRVVIATPTKCASTSLEAMVKRKVHRERAVEVVRPGQHRADCPEQAEGYRRLLLVRDPWARLLSAWTHLSTPSRAAEHHAKRIQLMSFREYVTYWIGHRAEMEVPGKLDGTDPELVYHGAYPWLVSLSEFAGLWQPEGQVESERLRASLASNGLDYGPEARNNSYARRRPGSWPDYWDAALLEEAVPLRADGERFGYAPPASPSGLFCDRPLSALQRSMRLAGGEV